MESALILHRETHSLHTKMFSCVGVVISAAGDLEEVPSSTLKLRDFLSLFSLSTVLKQRRETDAALFSELHRKLQTQVGAYDPSQM